MRSGRAVVLASAVLAALCAASAACSAILGLQPPPSPDGGDDDATSQDGPPSDGPPAEDGGPDAASDAASDAGDMSDAPVCQPLAAGDGSTTYNPLREALDEAGVPRWQFFETGSVNMQAQAYMGGVFDGRYVYYAPSSNGIVLRYDTQAPFATMASWTTFDTSTLEAKAQGYSGAVYDGRYMYLVPFRAPGGYNGLIVRYDTQLRFDTSAGWSVFDLTTLPVDGGSTLVGFGGGVFDGHAVYFAPHYDGVEHVSRVVQYTPAPAGVTPGDADGGAASVDGGPHDAGDAGVSAPHDGGDAGDSGNDAGDAGDSGPHDASVASEAGEAGPPQFATASQFMVFDVSTRNSSAAGYIGALFDGQYVYTVPYTNDVGDNGVLARYDTDGGFMSGASWTTYDTSAINQLADGFTGAAFDGRFVYMVPHQNTVAVRFDTQGGPITSKAAWSSFDLATLTPVDAGAPSFSGAGFDGRFIYYVPSTIGGQAYGGVTRYDTWSTFTAACAWSVFDVSETTASARNFSGAVYDGQYLYLVPIGTYAARFDTKTPASIPALPAFQGSFL
jgi:hypothetical protein